MWPHAWVWWRTWKAFLNPEMEPAPAVDEDQDEAHGLSYSATMRAISEFFEVAIHTLLFVRGVYPDNLFVRRRKYDTVVFQARHPALRDYISSACNAVREELLLGTVRRVAVVISDGETPLERFVFDVSPTGDVADEPDAPMLDGLDAAGLAQRFRGFMLKLAAVEGMLRPLADLSDDAAFAVVLELADGAVPTAAEPEQPPPWVPAQRPQTTAGVRDAGTALEHFVTAIDTQILRVWLSVQETRRQDKGKGKGKDEDKDKVKTSQEALPIISITSAT